MVDFAGDSVVAVLNKLNILHFRTTVANIKCSSFSRSFCIIFLVTQKNVKEKHISTFYDWKIEYQRSLIGSSDEQWETTKKLPLLCYRQYNWTRVGTLYQNLAKYSLVSGPTSHPSDTPTSGMDKIKTFRDRSLNSSKLSVKVRKL